MKTIADLNSKWWYRLVKVVYVFLLLLLIAGTLVGIYFIFEPKFDNENSYITCENGESYKLSDNGIYTYSGYLDSTDKGKVQKLCATPIKMTTEEYEKKYGQGLTREQLEEMGAEPKALDLEKYRLAKYDLVSVYTERNWYGTIGFVLLSLFGWVLFFEIVRRIFYYIVLGSLIPRKNA
jgi:hypothetical protein